jgi:hypothetical protein
LSISFIPFGYQNFANTCVGFFENCWFRVFIVFQSWLLLIVGRSTFVKFVDVNLKQLLYDCYVDLQTIEKEGLATILFGYASFSLVWFWFGLVCYIRFCLNLSDERMLTVWIRWWNTHIIKVVYFEITHRDKSNNIL